MARKLDRLTARAVAAKATPGYYADGAGLYLQVTRSGTKNWLLCYTLNGREREMGLGSIRDVSIQEARERRDNCRKQLHAGIDPIEARRQQQSEDALAAARSLTFSDCAKSYIEAHRAEWKNAKHCDQWTNTLETYCAPVFGILAVQHVDTALVVRALEKIWATKPETASRVRSRIECVLDWAKVRGYRDGENPARWRGHLDKLLAKLEKKKRVKHHPALPYDDMSAFMSTLRTREEPSARALELLILTATRTGETIHAKWSEFDLQSALWTIPADRMKAGREHRVPLTPVAVAMLQKLKDAAQTDYVFPSKRGKPLSNMALLKLLERMERTDITVHGFRSTFRDWAAERTHYPREVCEMALAHTISDQVEAAYRRGDLFEKRRRLMLEWERYCGSSGKAGEVVPMEPRRRMVIKKPASA